MHIPDSKRLLIRIDDAGVNLDTNRGVEAAARAGFARSVGMMACAPEFADAARRVRDIPGLALGVHLTLNAEWTNLRWRPLLPVEEVPSLVDADGFFPLNHQLYRQHPPVIEEVLAELRAQIARVRAEGLNPCYADEHMVFTSVSPQLAAPIRELLAGEGLLYALDAGLRGLRPKPNPGLESWSHAAAQAAPGDYLLVTHPAAEGPGIHSLTLPGKATGAAALPRIAEGLALTDNRLGASLAEAGVVRLISYADLRP